MLVEDHPEYREVIEIALKSEQDIELVSKFGAAEVALRSLQNLNQGPKPDIILLDLNLPGMSGLDALPHFSVELPNANVIILTQSDRESDVLSAISHGASGYLLKQSTVQKIKETIRIVHSGGASLDSRIAKYIFKTLQSRSQHEPEKILSARELQVLVLLGDGLLKKEIGEKLNISFSTVATHIRHIYEKLNVLNAPAAVSKAYRAGILPISEDD